MVEKRMTPPRTALDSTHPDDGELGRQQRGMAIAATQPVKRTPLGFKVPSQSDNGSYAVSLEEGNLYCACQDFELRQRPCKHIFAASYTAQRENPDEETTGPNLGEVADCEPVADDPPEPEPEPETETESAPSVIAVSSAVAEKPNWSAYSKAQTAEAELFGTLLRDLCATIEEPPPRPSGRPRLSLSDVVLSAGLKVYGTVSGRRAMTGLRRAEADGLLEKHPSFSSVFRYLREPALTPLLRELIQLSALPFAGVETDFAVDSSGFSTKFHERHRIHKWEKEIPYSKWVKVHIICGVLTNVVTDIKAENGQSADVIHWKEFVQNTARHFRVEEVSGDKAYLSRANLRAVEEVGGTAYIPFKVNSVAHSGHHRRDPLWEKFYHYFQMHREDFLAHYHKRSNVETTFHMVKSKFGPSVRAKSDCGQVNEALVKFLCHNIVVLIQAMFELGLDTTFPAREIRLRDSLVAA